MSTVSVISNASNPKAKTPNKISKIVDGHRKKYTYPIILQEYDVRKRSLVYMKFHIIFHILKLLKSINS